MTSGHASKRTSVSAPSPPPGDGRQKRRKMVSVACDFCRTRKMKCDGLRPTCTPCSTRSRTCRYESELPFAGRSHALREDNRVLRDEIGHLKRQLDDSLRRGSAGDPSAVPPSSTVSPNDLQFAPFHLIQEAGPSTVAFSPSPSYLQTVWSTLPPMESVLEFELMCKHPNAYQVLEPFTDSESVANALISLGDSPVEIDGTNWLGRTPSPPRQNTLCDDRLRDLHIAYWTVVPISDDYAASIISLYLENQHPILGTFDADLFLQDLVGQRLRFCSPLLVNAVLYYGCQAYTHFDLDASYLSWAFYAEAKKIWQADQSCDSLMNVAGLHIMSLAGSCNGNDREGGEFFNLCRDMAERLELQNDSAGAAHLRQNEQSTPLSDELRSKSHIAWGCFIIMNAFASYYQHAPTKGTPSLPIPGSPGFPLPEYMGSTFTALCEFWLIGRETAILYEGDPETVTGRVPLAAVESKYQRLLAFADTRLLSSANTRITHHAAVLHIWYHAAIVSLMRPWVGKQLILRTFDSVGSSPEGICSASLRQLKRLMINFRLFYPQATYNLHWHPCLMYIANSALNDSDHDPEWQFYFMACLYGYAILYPAYRLAELCFKGLLTIAMERRKISPAKARYLLKELSQRGKHHQTGNPYSGIRLDLDAGNSKERPGTVEDLAARFESTALHDDEDDDDAKNDDIADDDALFEELIDLDADLLGGPQ